MKNFPRRHWYDDASSLIEPGENKYGIDYIAFSGGGARGVSYCGVLNALHELKIIPHVRAWSGSSIGSFFALAGCLNADPYHLFHLILSMDGGGFIDTERTKGSGTIHSLWKWYEDLVGLVSEYGIAKGAALTEFILGFLQHYGFREESTFEDLYRETKKTLIIAVTDIEQSSLVYLSYWTHPFVRLIDALRGSMSIPFLFRPVTLQSFFQNDQRVVDGGLYNNYPLQAFDLFTEDGSSYGYNNRALGFFLTDRICAPRSPPVSDVKQFSMALISGLNCRLHHLAAREPYFWERTVVIETPDISPMSFSVDLLHKYQLNNRSYHITLHALMERRRDIERQKGISESIFIPSPEARTWGIKRIPNEAINRMAFHCPQGGNPSQVVGR
jgi:predicted acylesterase/phospholipase RssA